MASTGPGDGASETPLHSPEASYAVKLPIFEGPLDLLLHLIRINEVDVADIPIGVVADQYVEYVDLMRELNLDVAGEYLLMAATLAWIKSRMLLPPSGIEEDEEGVDPRAELVARLLEYQRFKEAAGELGERPLLGRDVFEARTPEVESTPESEREVAVDLMALIEAFRRVVRNAPGEPHAHEVESEPITVHERMTVVMDLLERQEVVEFERLLVAGESPATRPVVVATFLAILELARLAALSIFQSLSETGAPEGTIRVRRASGDEAGHWNERVADVM